MVAQEEDVVAHVTAVMVESPVHFTEIWSISQRHEFRDVVQCLLLWSKGLERPMEGMRQSWLGCHSLPGGAGWFRGHRRHPHDFVSVSLA